MGTFKISSKTIYQPRQGKPNLLLDALVFYKPSLEASAYLSNHLAGKGETPMANFFNDSK